MNLEEFIKKIKTLRQSSSHFTEDKNSEYLDPLLIYEQLLTALEELQVAEAELIQQNEELQITRDLIDQERQRYQELFEFAPDSYIVTDVSGQIQEVNEAAIALLNLPRVSLIRKPLSVFIAESERAIFRLRLQRLQQESTQQEWEMRLQSRRGQPLDVAATVAVVRDNWARPIMLRWLLRDITARKQVERQVKKLNAELMQRSLFETSLKRIRDKVRERLDESQILQTAVQELAIGLHLRACDTAMYDLQTGTSTVCYQYSAPGVLMPSVVGQVIQMAAFPDGYSQLQQAQTFQFCEITTDPARSQVAILACPIADHEGVIGDLWCFSDGERALQEVEVNLVQQVADQCATAIRQARLYQTAQAQVEELAKLNLLKDDFLSTVSHELRTPLANIKMASQLLQIASTPEQREKYLKVLQGECDREAALINDLLDLQRLESNLQSNFVPEAINLSTWLPNLITSLQLKAKAHRQNLQLDLPASLPVFIIDQGSLERLLVELLHNAYKYTAADGEIILQVRATSAVTTFTVRNQAEISAEQLPRIFDKFYRIPHADRWKQGGTGLGLSLVKRLVEQLQGTVEVESRGGWTTFTVQLPNHPSRNE
ncbi:ATP-binding protein [Trichocoleus sp. FACHB-262]|uniref:sensor histidine kinase n=1 Tax=Trichocoleus sp. FACHB-262 TaxID=2692869 RepID=UPI0016893FF6|nr:ATP-binding protein [Trichocoleus sp. FACHB-262]MBD2120845.1 PAS domain-containing protein [Trichocoleus sp. FACHB-262]